MSEEARDLANDMAILWERGELVTFAYEVAVLYSSHNYRKIDETMRHFKEKIES